MKEIGIWELRAMYAVLVAAILSVGDSDWNAIAALCFAASGGVTVLLGFLRGKNGRT